MEEVGFLPGRCGADRKLGKRSLLTSLRKPSRGSFYGGVVVVKWGI